MGAKTGLSAEEYLRTTFADLDREYRDGELVERSLPDYLHTGKRSYSWPRFSLLCESGFPFFLALRPG